MAIDNILDRSIDVRFDIIRSHIHKTLPSFYPPPSNMGRQKDVVHFPNLTFRQRRLHLLSVQPSACNNIFLHTLDQFRFIDDCTTSSIDQKGGRFHSTNFSRSNRMAGFVIQGTIDGNEIRGGQQLVHGHNFDLRVVLVFVPRRKTPRTTGYEDVHSQWQSHIGNGGANRSTPADEPQFLPGNFVDWMLKDVKILMIAFVKHFGLLKNSRREVHDICYNHVCHTLSRISWDVDHINST
mmetsp:Transcript_37096/g.66829  ORF Transcript_37096/g.66829 Transcript_37096/m.66829 type:complete len:238 (-) Transcript_37096:487-1200(-)